MSTHRYQKRLSAQKYYLPLDLQKESQSNTIITQTLENISTLLESVSKIVKKLKEELVRF
jgi:hypothetical protein